MTNDTWSPRGDTCLLLSVSAAVICWLLILVYVVKFCGGWFDGASRRLTEDGLEFGIIAVVALLPLTVAGIALAAFATGNRKVAFGAQGVTVLLGVGIVMLFDWLG